MCSASGRVGVLNAHAGSVTCDPGIYIWREALRTRFALNFGKANRYDYE